MSSKRGKKTKPSQQAAPVAVPEHGLTIKQSRSGVSVEVKVKPRSSRACIEGVEGGLLVVRLTAPPAEGQANEQLLEVLSDALSVPKSMITILRGGHSRTKLVEIGLSAETLAKRLSNLST